MTGHRWIGAADPLSCLVVRVDVPSYEDDTPARAARRGLAANPAAPAEVLLSLMATDPVAFAAGLRFRNAVPGAVALHDEPGVRAALAGNRQLDPALRLSLAGDPDARVRWALQSDRFLDLPPGYFTPDFDLLLRFVRRGLIERPEVAGEVTMIIGTDRRALRDAVHHADPVIRRAIPEGLTPRYGTSDAWVAPLAGDPDPEVRAAVAAYYASSDDRPRTRADLPRHGYHRRFAIGNRPLSAEVLADLFAADDPMHLELLAANPHLPDDAVAALLAHPAAGVRHGLTGRADLSDERLAALAADPDPDVRNAVSVHPAMPEAMRAGIELDLTRRGFGYHEPPPAPPDPPPLADVLAWAGSVNPLLRRRAATDDRLPPGPVTVLAEDHDPGVRLLLAHHHPAAVPPGLLLRVFREHPDRARGRLPHLPNFPRLGLSALAGDPDPAVRALATLDPGVAPGTVTALLEDTDAAVRRAAAVCPRLPAGRLVPLLDDPELAEPAAANPSLPEPAMRRLASSG